MKTDELVQRLASSGAPVDRDALRRHFWSPLGGAAAVCLIAVLAFAGPRPDWREAALLPMFWIKLAFPAAIALAAIALLRDLGHPGARGRAAALALVLPFVVVCVHGRDGPCFCRARTTRVARSWRLLAEVPGDHPGIGGSCACVRHRRRAQPRSDSTLAHGRDRRPGCRRCRGDSVCAALRRDAGAVSRRLVRPRNAHSGCRGLARGPPLLRW